MSAPTVERSVGLGSVEVGEKLDSSEVTFSAHPVETTMGRAAIAGEVAYHDRFVSHEDAEAFFAEFIGDKLAADSTGFSVTPEGATVRLSRVTAAEELVHIELPEADERLGATGLLIDAQRIEAEDPHLNNSEALVKAAKTCRAEDGILMIDRLYSEEDWQYAVERTAEIIAGINAKPSVGDLERHQKSYELSGALRMKHSEVTL